MNKEQFLKEVNSLSKSTDASLWQELFVFSLASEEDGYQIPYFDALLIKIKKLADKNEAKNVIDAVKHLWKTPVSAMDTKEYVMSLDQIFSCFSDASLADYASFFSQDYVESIIDIKEYELEDRVYLMLRISSMTVLKAYKKDFFSSEFFSNVKKEYPIAWVDILIYSGQYTAFFADIFSVLKENYSDFGRSYYQDRLEIWDSYLSQKDLEGLQRLIVTLVLPIKRNNSNISNKSFSQFFAMPKGYDANPAKRNKAYATA